MSEPFREADHEADTDRLVETQKFGTTNAEQDAGESLDGRLAQEVPDVGEHDPVDDIVAADPATFAADDVDAELTDEDVLDDVYSDPDTGSDPEAAMHMEEVR